MCTFRQIIKWGSSNSFRTSKTAKYMGRATQLLNCRVRVCVRNKSTLKEKQYRVRVSHKTPPTSELNLSRQTPQELGFLFSGEVNPKPGPIRALWTWSICNRTSITLKGHDWFKTVKDWVGNESDHLRHKWQAIWKRYAPLRDAHIFNVSG